MKPPDGYEIGTAYAKDKTGTYFRAVQLKLDRPVTLKVLREDLWKNKKAHELFLQESQVIAGLEHPNLLLSISTGKVDGIPYFVTESTAEPSLAEALKPREAVAEMRAVSIALGIGRAFKYLQERQLIYKNVRQHNILLPRPTSPKLVTFRYVRSVSVAQSFCGANVQSGSYCAPELVRDDLGPVTIKANVYALGALLYRMLSGVPPVEGTSAEARTAHAKGKVRPLKECKPFLRDRAYATVDALMCHDPKRRVDPAAAVALLEAYSNDPLVTHPPKTRKKRRRRRR